MLYLVATQTECWIQGYSGVVTETSDLPADVTCVLS